MIIYARAQQRAASFNVPNHYPHLDQQLAGAAFDLLVNLTDMQEHGRLNQQALRAGKHVWSEKPMANTYKEGRVTRVRYFDTRTSTGDIKRVREFLTASFFIDHFDGTRSLSL